MRQSYLPKVSALAISGCAVLWTAQVSAASDIDQATLNQLQQQIQQLQQQVNELKAKQREQEKKQEQLARKPTELKTPEQVAASSQQEHGNEESALNLHAGIEATYWLADKGNHGRASGGDLTFDHFMLGAKGDLSNGLSYDSEYRWDSGDNYLHYGYVAYDFGTGSSSQIKGGYIQVPFGNLFYGYTSYWAPASYYLALNDAQAAGLDYKYENNSWRFDIAAFKNDDLGQNTTYGATTSNSQGYHQINGGILRIARKFDFSDDNALEISLSGRGGQLNVDSPSGHKNGSHWAAALAAQVTLGQWTFMAQANDYRYNVPSGAGLERGYLWFQEGGGDYKIPASGELYSFSFNRTFPVEGMGPISEFDLYNDFNYLHRSSTAGYTYNGKPIGNTTNNILGLSMTAGPLIVWAEWVAAKNGSLAYAGDSDGQWHHAFELTAGYYFDGDLIQ
jgi:hypothetical protein